MNHARLFLSLLLFSLGARAADWRQFRGPESTGVAAEGDIPAAPRIEWSVPLPGRGLASPIVVGEKVFLTASSGPRQARLHLLCFSAADGTRLWERQLQATGRTMAQAKTSVAACTPCSDGQRVFALWSSNDLAAFDLEGNLLWLRGLTADYPNASNSLGMASSPIVIGETLVVMIENDSESYSLGLDVHTGRNLWKFDRPKAANWTSPIPWRPRPESPWAVLLQSSRGLLAVDPASGSRLWEYTEGASTISSSVVANGVIFAPSSGITALRAPSGGPVPEQVWRSRMTNPSTISPLVLRDQLYSINGAGVLAATDVQTGEARWKLRLTGPFSSSPVGAGDRVLVVSEKGLVQVAAVTKTEGVVAATLQLPLRAGSEELILCTPALSGGRVYLRTDSTLWRLGE